MRIAESDEVSQVYFLPRAGLDLFPVMLRWSRVCALEMDDHDENEWKTILVITHISRAEIFQKDLYFRRVRYGQKRHDSMSLGARLRLGTNVVSPISAKCDSAWDNLCEVSIFSGVGEQEDHLPLGF